MQTDTQPCVSRCGSNPIKRQNEYSQYNWDLEPQCSKKLKSSTTEEKNNSKYENNQECIQNQQLNSEKLTEVLRQRSQSSLSRNSELSDQSLFNSDLNKMRLASKMESFTAKAADTSQEWNQDYFMGTLSDLSAQGNFLNQPSDQTILSGQKSTNQSPELDNKFLEISEICLKEIQQLITEYSGKIVSIPSNLVDEAAILQCSCIMNHIFDTSLIELKQNVWCKICQSDLETAKKYAHQHGGSVQNKYFVKKLTFCCSKGHEFTLSHNNFKSKWCEKCNKQNKVEQKEEIKKIIEQEEAKINQEYEEKQQRMFEESRKRSQSFSLKAQQLNDLIGEKIQKYIQAEKVVEAQIEKLAEKQAQQYLQLEGHAETCTYDQIKQVYKVLLFPDLVMQVYFCNIDEATLKREYKQLALAVHPDKNPHPKSSQAFSKLNHFYTLATNLKKSQKEI